MPKEKILQAFQFRHACKEFDTSRSITKDDFAFILETARLSPSSFGFEPWRFVIAQKPELRQALLTVTWGAQLTLPTASHFVLVLARKSAAMLPQSDHIQYMMKQVQGLPEEAAAGKQERYRLFLDEDFRLLGNDRAMFEWACRQTYIAAGNMMTAAAQIGIDSCPIEGFDMVKVEELLAREGILDPEEFGVSCMLAFGYRIKDPRDKTRQTMDRITSWIE